MGGLVRVWCARSAWSRARTTGRPLLHWNGKVGVARLRGDLDRREESEAVNCHRQCRESSQQALLFPRTGRHSLTRVPLKG